MIIRERALEKGIVSPAEFEHFKKEDDFALIIKAGFSTKDVATEYSGRGVGLDVVQKNINDLGGAVTLSSAFSEGTTFEIKLSKS